MAEIVGYTSFFLAQAIFSQSINDLNLLVNNKKNERKRLSASHSNMSAALDDKPRVQITKDL